MIGVAILMFISAFIAFRNNTDDSFDPLVFSGMAALLSGFFAIIGTKPQEKMTIEDGFRIVTGCWIAACIFGAIPYLLFGGEFTVVNAFFESVSGFTTTGASILNNIEALPNGLQFWRIASAWIGGIGIVTLVSLVISGQHDRHSVLASAELSDLAKSYYGGRKKHFVYRMIVVYLIITSVSAIALRLTKMPWFDATTLAMSACSTCGFCTKNISVAFYDSWVVEAILCIAMSPLLFSLSRPTCTSVVIALLSRRLCVWRLSKFVPYQQRPASPPPTPTYGQRVAWLFYCFALWSADALAPPLAA